MPSSKRSSTILQLAIAAFAISASWTVAVAVARPVDDSTRRAVVEKLATELRDRYVLPAVGERAAAAVEGRSREGAYDAVDTPGAFAARLTADLRLVTHDKHLLVKVDGAAPASLNEVPHSEAGVVRADLLSGDVGYVEIASFPPPHIFRPVIDRAMKALVGSKALVIDVRRNTGGSPASVAYLVSFLLPLGNLTLINEVVSRTPATMTFERQRFTSEPTPVTFSLLPVYVLTSADTFSGGEEFAYDVQSLKVAKVIGETTGGGANPSEIISLGSGYSAQIPFGRAENPITRSNWEGRGVTPDIESRADDALAVALQRLNQPVAREISQASRKQVFAPRVAPIPGSEAALRRVLAEVAAGKPDYVSMSANAETKTKASLTRLQSTLVRLGELRTLTFVEVDEFGGDEYDAKFYNGSARAAIVLNTDGKIDGWGVFKVAYTKNGE